MGETILTKDQRFFLKEFAKSPLTPFFYLTGGTALAEFYLMHRYSDDLDFFTNQADFPQIEVEGFVRQIAILLKAEADYKRLYDRRIFYFQFKEQKEELKIEFTSYPFPQINPPQKKAGIFADSLQDIAVNKMMAMIDRTEPKDFFDLYWLIKEHFSVKELIDGVKRKFGFHIDLLSIGSDFAKVKNMSFPIRKIKSVSDEEIIKFFEDQSRALKPNILNAQ